MGSEPERTCAGCGRKLSKRELIRIGYDGDFEVSFWKGIGRGVYVCPNWKCYQKAKKRNAFSKSLKTNVPVWVYERIESMVEEKLKETGKSCK